MGNIYLNVTILIQNIMYQDNVIRHLYFIIKIAYNRGLHK